MATYGVIATACVVYLHHIQVAVYVRNWTWWLLFWLCLSMAAFPLTCYLAESNLYSPYYKSIYGQFLPSLMLDANILLIVGAFSAPIIFHKFVHELILWPKFFTRD